MLNLTDAAITLLAQNGETTTCAPSSYIARVEYERRGVADCLHECRAEGLCFFIPLIEETPKEIVAVKGDEVFHLVMHLRDEDSHLRPSLGVGDEMLLVTREVAEAAAYLRRVTCGRNDCADAMHHLHHLLAARMVWASDPREIELKPENDSMAAAMASRRIGYRELHRVPRVGR